MDKANINSYHYIYDNILDIQSILFDYKDNYRSLKFLCPSTQEWKWAPFSSQEYANDVYNLISDLLKK